MWFKKRIKFFIFITITLSIGIYISYQPWVHYRKQKTLVNQYNSRLKNLEKEWINLKAEQVKIENSFGKEKLARERGFRKDNEKSLDEKNKN